MGISDNTWLAITAVATCVLTLFTGLIAYGVPRSIRSSRDDARNRFYAQLDGIYMRIQELVIQTPHLAGAADDRTPEQAIQYDAYAYIVWNFVESIFDYSREDRSLLVTWKCIFVYESQRHRAWFDRPENRTKFKPLFQHYVDHDCINKE
jgi:hypothetical protein